MKSFIGIFAKNTAIYPPILTLKIKEKQNKEKPYLIFPPLNRHYSGKITEKNQNILMRFL